MDLKSGLNLFQYTDLQDFLVDWFARRASVPGSVEAMLLPTLALLRAQGAEMSPAALEPLLRTPVPPDALDAACSALEEGANIGVFRSARMLALAPPGRPESLSTVGWHGRLDLARDVQLRLRAEERTLWAMTWTADEPAERGASALLDRLEEALSEVVQATLGEPVRQLLTIQVEQVRMAEWLTDDGAVEQSWPPSLRARQPGTKVPLEVSSPAPRADGRPCLYATTAFHAFAQEWIAWRKRRDKASSATWMGKQMGVSRSLAHALAKRAAEPVQAAVERYRTALQAEMIQAQERIAAGGASPATVLISANQIFPLTEPLEPTWTRRRRRR